MPQSMSVILPEVTVMDDLLYFAVYVLSQYLTVLVGMVTGLLLTIWITVRASKTIFTLLR